MVMTGNISNNINLLWLLYVTGVNICLLFLLVASDFRANKLVLVDRLRYVLCLHRSLYGKPDMSANLTIDDKKHATKKWFEKLRDDFCVRLSSIEEQAGDLYQEWQPGSFKQTPWQRGDAGEADQGGGVMSMMRGRVFEKVGVHVSTVYGEFSEEFRKNIPGAQDDPRFWASGISLIAHTRNPHAPSAHMNTRMIVTTKSWFGGGGDLNPMMNAYRGQDHEDTIYFHTMMEQACSLHDKDYYPKFKKWCDEYFYLPHRKEPRGIGGIFYDRHDSGDWQKDFSFTQDVGKVFLEAYPNLVEKRMTEPWDNEDKKEQAMRRGRYAEFNLLYDRGTQFGLKTGGNVESILSSLPPMAEWQ